MSKGIAIKRVEIMDFFVFRGGFNLDFSPGVLVDAVKYYCNQNNGGVYELRVYY
jgi:hypothetical protein